MTITAFPPNEGMFLTMHSIARSRARSESQNMAMAQYREWREEWREELLDGFAAPVSHDAGSDFPGL
jgi:hypothetical protein